MAHTRRQGQILALAEIFVAKNAWRVRLVCRLMKTWFRFWNWGLGVLVFEFMREVNLYLEFKKTLQLKDLCSVQGRSTGVPRSYETATPYDHHRVLGAGLL